MNNLSRTMLKLVLFGEITIILLAGAACAGGLSPPVILSPIYNGAQIVSISGFVPNAEVKVYANNGEFLGSASFWYPRLEISTNRKLNENDKIYATQTIGGKTSDPPPDTDKVTVEKLPADILKEETLSAPIIIPPLAKCQQLVRIRNILPGATVLVSSDAAPTLSHDTPYNYINMITHELETNEKITASVKMDSLNSDPDEKSVGEKPNSLADAHPQKETSFKGATMVVIDNCYPGAVAEILSYGTKIGGGIVAGETTVFPVNPPLKAGANQLSVKQSLCGKEMGESTTYDVTDSLDSFKKPYIETPICDGSDRVPVCNTFTGYTVRVFDEANVNEPLAEAGATGSCRTPILDKKATLKNGQNIYAEQEFGAMQKKSDIIEVGKNPGPLFGVINGDCHGVFKRETFTGANGPIFRAALCGGLEPYVDIIGPNGNPTTTINLVKTNQKGYFENTWIVDPAAMPEGTYTARFHITDSSGEKQEVKFFSVYSLKSPESKVKLEVLCAHNKVREEVHSENPSVPPIDPLIWSDKLASSAQNWAEHLASIGKLEHSGSGENLSSIGSSYTDSIESWADEKKDNLQDSWANELWSGQSHKFPDAGPQVCACPGNCKGQNLCYISKTCDFCDFGHYTQIVWRGTNEVGCGEKDGIRVCQYAPAGNTWGGKVY